MTGQQVIAPWAGRRKVEATRRVREEGRRAGSLCVICKQPIDYDLPSSHPDSCSVQHLKPKSLYPLLTWAPSNWGPAHLSCNKSAGANVSESPEVTSQDW